MLNVALFVYFCSTCLCCRKGVHVKNTTYSLEISIVPLLGIKIDQQVKISYVTALKKCARRLDMKGSLPITL